MSEYQVETGLDEGDEARQARELREGIRIEAPKEPEVDPIHYRDVESLVFRGFLITSAEINGVKFLFKSMNHHEYEYLQWVTGTDATERYYNTFLAYGVFMIDGQNILPERERWVPELEKMFQSLPPLARSKVIRHLSEVNRKAAKAITLTEAYQMERISRFRWAQHKDLDLMKSTVTGIDGSDKLGMNYAQLVWRALNYYEDSRDTAEREWENAKFIGSCFAGKEIRKIYSQDKDRRQKETEERIQRKDQVIRQVLLGEDLNKDQTRGGIKMVVAKTVEELAEQLERDLRGEKDWHDEIVAREEETLRQQVMARQSQMRELHESNERTQVPMALAKTNLTGMTIEQVRERQLRGRQYEAQEAAGRVVHPEMMDERVYNFVQRHLLPEESSGQGSTVGPSDQDPTNAQPLVPPRPPGKPFRR